MTRALPRCSRSLGLLPRLLASIDRQDPPQLVKADAAAWLCRKKLGTIRIDRIAAEEAKLDKTLVFMPGNPPPGIEAADPMLAVRNQAYSRSFDERQ